MYHFRLKILLALVGLTFLGLLSRMAWMQFVLGEDYRAQAERSLQDVELLPGMRGRITDRNGVVLAADEACHDFCLDYRLLSNDERWRRKQVNAILREQDGSRKNRDDLSRAEAEFTDRVTATWELARQIAAARGVDLDDSVARVRRSVERMHRAVGREIREERMAHAVVPGLDEENAARAREFMPRTVGASLKPGRRRVYPFGATACHIIGVTGLVGREDVQTHNLSADDADWLTRVQHNYLPHDTIGRTGVERMAEDRLRPRRGFRRFSRPGEVSETQDAIDGLDVHLTIDIVLQARLTEMFAATGHTGSLVVIDVPTGDVLAMVSWPTYDLNTYRQDFARLAGVVTDPDDPANVAAARQAMIDQPLRHRAIATTFAPGSTVKPLTAIAGLASDVITPDSTITCTGVNRHSRIGKPRCWYYKDYHLTHGPLTVVDGIKFSCNIFFVELGHRLGAGLLTHWFGLFGLGDVPHTGLIGERAGVLPTPAYMGRAHQRGYIPSDVWFISIGQGEIGASTTQLATAHATIARGPVYLSPRLCYDAGPAQVRRELPVRESDLAIVRKGMWKVVNERRGTAYKIFHQGGVEALPVELCGKTGTAATPPQRLDTHEPRGIIDPGDEIVREGDHAYFAGFAPYRAPKLAFAALAEYAGSGGRNAGPIVREAARICAELGYFD